jgi:taurine dioxygenase
VVRVHPETGEPALVLGHFVRSFTGLSSADSRDLFALLQRHVTRLENTVRWTWRDGEAGLGPVSGGRGPRPRGGGTGRRRR